MCRRRRCPARARAGTRVAPAGRVDDRLLPGPPPWPTASIAIVAMPRAAFRSAARNTSSFERPKPWPKIATGQPPAGGAPAGTISAKPTARRPVGARRAPRRRGARSRGRCCATTASAAGRTRTGRRWRRRRSARPRRVTPPRVVVWTILRHPGHGRRREDGLDLQAAVGLGDAELVVGGAAVDRRDHPALRQRRAHRREARRGRAPATRALTSIRYVAPACSCLTGCA